MFGDKDIILDFDDSEDLIDLRGLGVTKENFDRLVSITENETGLSIQIGDALMHILGEDDLSINDFVFDSATAAFDEPKRSGDLAAERPQWLGTPEYYGGVMIHELEDAIPPRWPTYTDLLI
jgi:hypothetical protein